MRIIYNRVNVAKVAMYTYDQHILLHKIRILINDDVLLPGYHCC